jgi:2-methylisocitrate lyase-like PEP mutase family enzyme
VVKTFRQLHDGPGVLLLANCWDAASARVLEHLGAPAIATTSAGLCWSNGFPDGDALPIDRLVASVRAITRVLRVPLTVDLEGGYSSDPEKVGELVAALLDAGTVGINLEDGAAPPELLAAKIERVKQRAARANVDLFVNARTDVFLRGLGPEPARVQESLARAARYRDAGADGLFVPKVVEASDIQTIASGCPLPLNVLAWPKLPPVAQLAALGARRLSSGSGLAQQAFGRLAATAAAFLREGRIDSDGAMTYAELNPLFPRS